MTIADRDRAIFVKGPMIAEDSEKELQRLGFHEQSGGRIVDHQMAEIGLAGNRAERRELRAGEACQKKRSRLRVRDGIKDGLIRMLRDFDILAEHRRLFCIMTHAAFLSISNSP